MTWILILYVSNSEARALTNIPGFQTEAQCIAAGRKAADEFGRAMFSSARYVCVEQATAKKVTP